MSTETRIDEIVDMTAAIAGGIEGVRVVFGAGSGLVDDPLRAGEKIQPGPPNPTEPFTHVSDLPDMGDLPLNAMVGTHIQTWRIPMRLFFEKSDISEVRRTALVFYRRYLTAFAASVSLEATARRWYRLGFRIGHDNDWAWLELTLNVDEKLILATSAVRSTP